MSFAGLDCTNLISTYPEDDPEEINKALKKKLMIAVGAVNVVCAVLLAVGVSYFAATVLQEFYSYEQVSFGHFLHLYPDIVATIIFSRFNGPWRN